MLGYFTMSRNFTVNDAILQLIKTRDVTSQTDLMLELRTMGYSVAQATLSRKLKALRVFKISGRYSIPDGINSHFPTVLSMEASDGGLVVLHTPPGCASGLACHIDREYVFNASGRDVPILGTIAGDDTVLVVVRRRSDVEGVLSALRCEFCRP
jgi:transcriptional regulator of arginine metabolism